MMGFFGGQSMSDTDDPPRLETAAAAHLSADAEAQIVALLFTWVRTDQPAWLPPEAERALWPTEERIGWLEGRPDVRARIVHHLTDVSEGAASRLAPEVQIALIDAVVDEGDVSVARWAEAW